MYPAGHAPSGERTSLPLARVWTLTRRVRRRRGREYFRCMTVVLSKDDRDGPSVVRIGCDGCHRSVAGNARSADELRDLVRWEVLDGSDLCTVCIWERGTTPK